MKRSPRFPKVRKRQPRRNFFGEVVQESSDEAPDYIYPAELRKEIYSQIKKDKTDSRIAKAALYQIYQQQHKLDKEMKDEIKLAQNKFRQRTKIIADRARQIVNGKQEGIERINDFWPKLIKNSSFEVIIQQKDKEVIDSIIDLDTNYIPSAKVVQVTMRFSKNPMFDSQILNAVFTQHSIKIINHHYTLPTFKKGYKKLKNSFFSIFMKLDKDRLINFYQMWRNFILKEQPQHLAFYFALRQGTYIARIPKYESEEDESKHNQEQKIEQRPKHTSVFGQFAFKPSQTKMSSRKKFKEDQDEAEEEEEQMQHQQEDQQAQQQGQWQSQKQEQQEQQIPKGKSNNRKNNQIKQVKQTFLVAKGNASKANRSKEPVSKSKSKSKLIEQKMQQRIKTNSRSKIQAKKTPKKQVAQPKSHSKSKAQKQLKEDKKASPKRNTSKSSKKQKQSKPTEPEPRATRSKFKQEKSTSKIRKK